MITPRKANRALRAATVVLVVIGLAVHLWLGTQIGLVLVVIGVAAHLAAAALGRIWWTRRSTQVGGTGGQSKPV